VSSLIVDYQKKWTEELFIIRHHFLREGIPVYQIKDFEDGNIDGTFYQQELQKVNEDEDKAWKMEKILKRRKRRGYYLCLYVYAIKRSRIFPLWYLYTHYCTRTSL
jgi:hypothetical protein